MMGTRLRLALLSGLLLGVMVGAAGADVLVTRDGRKFEGKLLQEDQFRVVFEVHRYGAKITMTFPRAEVRSLTRAPLKPDKPDEQPDNDPDKTGGEQSGSGSGQEPDKENDGLNIGPAPEAPEVVESDKPCYCIIPFHGEVGFSVRAAVLEKSFADAVKRKPEAVILLVDSPGGSVDEVVLILDVIRKYNRKLRIVAFVKKSLSAAAIACLTVKEIYMHPSGIIGAATSYTTDYFGMPVELSEKRQSIWRATARSSAETGEHSSLLAEAMIDNSLQLYTIQQDGKKIVREGKLPEGGRVICRAGRLLTMTANETIQCGLADGKAQSLEELGKALGFEDWTQRHCLGEVLSAYWDDVMDKLGGRMKSLLSDFRENMRDGRIHHPSRDSYEVHPHTGRFTPQSQRRWKQNSIECAKYLRAAEEKLQAATDLCTRYPQFLPEVNYFEEYRKELAASRRDITKHMNRTTPPSRDARLR